MTTNNNSHLAVQTHIILHLGPNFGNLVIWGHCQYPTILNLESLYLSPEFSLLSQPLHILSNNSSLAIHELTNGHALLAASILSSRPYHSISALTAAFNRPCNASPLHYTIYENYAKNAIYVQYAPELTLVTALVTLSCHHVGAVTLMSLTRSQLVQSR